MTTRAKLTLSAALATALTALCLMPLFHDSMQLIPHGLLMIAAAAGIGAGLRVLPLPRGLVVPLQLLAVAYVLLLTSVQGSMAYGLLPGGRALAAAGELLRTGGEDIRQYSIPAPGTPGLRLIVISAVAVVAVLADALAVTYKRAAAAGLPLLALYSVGTGLSGGAGGSWLWFLFAAVGYLGLLYTEGQDRLSRWGRVFHGTGRASTGMAHGGQRVGVIALLFALVLPAFLPHAGLGLVGGFGGGSGTGTGIGGTGGGERSLNLVVALTANLRNNDDTELLRFTTESGEANEEYLRVAALSDFNGQEWTIGDQSLDAVPTPLPLPEGLSPTVATGSERTTVKLSDKLSTSWLPMPYPANWVEVGPLTNWRFDKAARTLSAQGQKLNNLQYTVGSATVQPTFEQLVAASAVPATVSNRYLELPENLPPVVAQTATDVTKGKKSKYEQAVALQDYFTSGAFTYSTKVEPRTGPDAIAKFLQDKDGFCVHFAATMAAMARSLHIPSRVAIGFTPGTGDSKARIVRSSNFHAWPELYFQGVGWLRFEPTPGRGVVPAYTRSQTAPSPAASSQQPSAGASDNASPSASGDTHCTAQQRKIGDCADDSLAVQHAAAGNAWWDNWQVLAVLSLIGLVLLLLTTPMLWRARLRRRRLGPGRHLPGAAKAADGAERAELSDAQVLAAWAELIDSAWDLGIPPDDARTPRHTVRRLAEAAELDAESEAAAGRVALATERVLYARTTDAPARLAADVRTARVGLRAHAGRLGRIRAVLLPASTVQVWWRIADRTMAARERVADGLAKARETVLRRLRRDGR
ncbi:DUF3488 and transglutaminase-like domain-containing protein [Kitasatospora cinereorecta]|uniref:DUF3488 and transglutaminase-like domain-containing protein n=1 Tax=Kitasatospora cinereorecta TaxID=285560 RepID=A0ABW0VHG5_9ACTN